jgi:hypothetical protein
MGRELLDAPRHVSRIGEAIWGLASKRALDEAGNLRGRNPSERGPGLC